MTRRHRLIALVAAGATVVSGCGSVANRDEVARVDDQVLDLATLEALVGVGKGAESVNGEYATTQVDGAINSWIWNEAIRAELDDRGVDVPAPTVGEPVPLKALETDVQAAYDALAKHENSREWTAEELAGRYEMLVCINVATTDTEEGATELIAALNEGSGFLEATELLASSGSTLGCSPPGAIGADVNNILAQAGVQIDPAAVEALPTSGAIGFWPSEFGFVVLQRGTLDEVVTLSPQSLKGEAALSDVVANHDISVDSLYGAFTPQGLWPLGI